MRKSLENKPSILYMARNKITDDFYIGVTSIGINGRRNLHLSESRKFKNKTYFHRAIRKYGEDNFLWTKIGGFSTYKEGLDAEIYLIKNMSPKYNLTIGGGGCVGLKFSEESKKIMSYKAFLRKEDWKKYSHLGPKSFSKKVLCVTDGKLFDSASAAARNYDACKSAIIELCLGKRGRKSVGGKIFKYLEKL